MRGGEDCPTGCEMPLNQLGKPISALGVQAI
jgi:hypothetical protein